MRKKSDIQKTHDTGSFFFQGAANKAKAGNMHIEKIRKKQAMCLQSISSSFLSFFFFSSKMNHMVEVRKNTFNHWNRIDAEMLPASCYQSFFLFISSFLINHLSLMVPMWLNDDALPNFFYCRSTIIIRGENLEIHIMNNNHKSFSTFIWDNFNTNYSAECFILISGRHSVSFFS